MKQTNFVVSAAIAVSLTALAAHAASEGEAPVADDVIAAQRAALAAATAGAGFGPQAPRDLGMAEGANARAFGTASDASEMALCNIHFHENAEHKGGEFTTYAGNGDGKGYGTGFKYDGTLTAAELTPLETPIGTSAHGDLEPGDTIEIHFVHSSAQVTPGPKLDSCVSEEILNPALRVETVVAVLVNDPAAADFTEMAALSEVEGRAQAPNIPDNLGEPIVYAGSTTGPGYNEKASPFQVTWSVRPKVIKLDINSVGAWIADNPFDEDHAHGVRNLVLNPDLLAPINE